MRVSRDRRVCLCCVRGIARLHAGPLDPLCASPVAAEQTTTNPEAQNHTRLLSVDSGRCKSERISGAGIRHHSAVLRPAAPEDDPFLPRPRFQRLTTSPASRPLALPPPPR